MNKVGHPRATTNVPYWVDCLHGIVTWHRSPKYQIPPRMGESQGKVALPRSPQYQIPLRMVESQEEERALPRSRIEQDQFKVEGGFIQEGLVHEEDELSKLVLIAQISICRSSKLQIGL